jgi:hypothetical protein
MVVSSKYCRYIFNYRYKLQLSVMRLVTRVTKVSSYTRNHEAQLSDRLSSSFVFVKKSAVGATSRKNGLLLGR